MAEPAAGLSRLPALPVVLGIGLAARLFVALAFPNVLAADEVFQFLEQAHRLVFGAGVVPWEFQIGLRSWLIPLLLAGPMALARLADPAPVAGLALIRILLCIASLSVVWCAANWGGRRFGTRGVWIVGGLAALWPALWLLAPHPLARLAHLGPALPQLLAQHLRQCLPARRHQLVRRLPDGLFL